LPSSIAHLTFGDCFNRPVNNLPHNITSGVQFNQPVDHLSNIIGVTFRLLTTQYYFKK